MENGKPTEHRIALKGTFVLKVIEPTRLLIILTCLSLNTDYHFLRDVR